MKKNVTGSATSENPIDERITRFIRKHHIFTLATSADNKPYTCSCFYVYREDINMFVFTSDEGTRHTNEMTVNPYVSGAIALETLVVGKIQGIQFTGTVHKLKGKEYKEGLASYLLRFPVAGFKELILWGIAPDFIKMTHNQLGFGKKLVWRAESGGRRAE
jgi:uncharacterized protein YhbP (UPF0306 family)